MKNLSKSCWNCNHHQAGGINALGKCMLVDKELKATPSASGGYVIDKGCAKWELKLGTTEYKKA